MKEHLSRGIGICFLLLSALLLFACAGSTASTAQVFTDPALTENTWQLTELNGVKASGESPALLAFGQANNLLGSTGCNLYTGSYLLGGQGVVDFNPTVTSAIDCTDALKVQDEAVAMVLSTASSYKIDGDTLQINNPDASQRATFAKTAPLTLAGSGWVLNAYNDGQGAIVTALQGSQVTAEFGADGNLSGSAGCNSYTASYEASETTIKIGAPVTTKMMCSEPQGVMDQETNYLAAIQKAATYRNLGIALVLFDQAGQPLVTYFSSAIIAGNE